MIEQLIRKKINSMTLEQRASLEKDVGVSVNYIRSALSRKIKFREALTVKLEKAFNDKRLTRKHIRPDVDWSIFK